MVTRSRWIPRGGSPWPLSWDSPRHLDPFQPIDHCYSKKTSFLFLMGQSVYRPFVLEQALPAVSPLPSWAEEKERQNILIPWIACNIYVNVICPPTPLILKSQWRPRMRRCRSCKGLALILLKMKTAGLCTSLFLLKNDITYYYYLHILFHMVYYRILNTSVPCAI